MIPNIESLCIRDEYRAPFPNLKGYKRLKFLEISSCRNLTDLYRIVDGCDNIQEIVANIFNVKKLKNVDYCSLEKLLRFHQLKKITIYFTEDIVYDPIRIRSLIKLFFGNNIMLKIYVSKKVINNPHSDFFQLIE